MSGVWGKNIEISIFGESHGEAIGIVINGLPGGVVLDIDYIKSEMARRAPGKNKLSTTRKERDSFEILSGYFKGSTTGTPLSAIIRNSDVRHKDYESIKNILRPGHGDYTGYIKYNGNNDYRGGGHFSGRLTAPLVFAGAICKKLLSKKNILIGSHIKSIGDISEEGFNDVDIESKLLEALSKSDFPVIDEDKGSLMRDCILKAKEELDSIGGIIETAIINLDPGIGSPYFYSVESKISSIIFSIPGVKGIEFGEGFDITRMKGSNANDEYYLKDKDIKTYSNNNGGILGGITNGMPVIFKTAFKPTPSIGKSQRTVDIKNMENVEFNINGRHDPCIVTRALPVVEAVAAIAILDLIIDSEGYKWMI